MIYALDTNVMIQAVERLSYGDETAKTGMTIPKIIICSREAFRFLKHLCWPELLSAYAII